VVLSVEKSVDASWGQVAVPYSVNVDVGETTRRPQGIVKVAVYYGTNRRLVDNQYSNKRSATINPLRYGICYVTIPPDHRIGVLEGPRWSRFEFRSNPQKHVVLETVSPIGRTGVLQTIRQQFLDHSKDRRRMLVFVHGYNVTFADAARRTAQIHYDLKFPGLSSFFSWPSNGRTRSYVSDTGDIEWSVPYIESFLRELNRTESIDEVFLIAHSMGNQGVIKALRNLTERNEGKKIKEVIFAAPDVDSMLFDRDFAKPICDYYPRVTVYASSKDLALWSSNVLSEAHRVGEIRAGEPTILSRANLDIIDASNVETGFLAHSYFADGTSVISDIFQLVRGKQGPGVRTNLLSPQTGRKGRFWLFRP